jgi:hypothetical protein
LAEKDAQAFQQLHEVVYEKTDGACTSSRKMAILCTEKPLQSQMDFFARKHSQIMLLKHICEVAATSMASFRVV